MASMDFSWLSLVLLADPDHTYESQNPIAYEFTSPGRGPGRGNDQVHLNGLRIFREPYATTGPYSTLPGDPLDRLQWQQQPLVWNGVPLTQSAHEPTS